MRPDRPAPSTSKGSSARTWTGRRNGSTLALCSRRSRPAWRHHRSLGFVIAPTAADRQRGPGGGGPRIGAAVATVLALVGGSLAWSNRVALARGEVVLRGARQTHQVPIDRCYLVEVRRESALAAELAPLTPPARSTRLWTRQDRFWVESTRPEQRWSWGRDAANRIWIAFNPHTGVRLEADEVPPWLNLYCDLHSLNVEQWLDDVLGRFEITREPATAASDPATILVSARARTTRRDRPSVASAEFEIDAETRVVRRMVVRRVWNDRPFATVTYSLVETDARPEAEYGIEGHIADPAAIFTRDHEPERRREILDRWFGAHPGRKGRNFEPFR